MLNDEKDEIYWRIQHDGRRIKDKYWRIRNEEWRIKDKG